MLTSQARNFHYRALRADGKPESGTLRARDTRDAAEAVARRGLFMLEISDTGDGWSFEAVLGAKRSPTAFDVAVTLRALATLLDAGVPITKALAALEHVVDSSVRTRLPEIARAVQEGNALSDAFHESGPGFSPIILAILRAGEAAGNLASAARNAAELAERLASSRAAIRAALTYPAILCTVGLLACGMMIVVVLPRFQSMLVDMGQPLPSSTLLVLELAAMARNASIPLAIAVGLGLLLGRRMLSDPKVRTRFHAALLRLPIVGSLRFTAATARVCTVLGEMLESGAPIGPSLTQAAFAASDSEVSRRLELARADVIAGSPLGVACARAQALTVLAVGLIRTGEESGRMSAMLMHAGRMENERALAQLNRVVKLIEPGLILLFGLVIALVCAAMLQAVYGLRVTA